MMNSINPVNTTNIELNAATKKADIKKLIKYANNEVLNEKPDTFTSTLKSTAGSAAVFEGIPFVKFLARNRKLPNGFKSNDMRTLDELTRKAFKNMFQGAEPITARVANFINTTNNNKKIYSQIKDTVKTAKKLTKAYDKATNGKLKQKAADKIMAKIDKMRPDYLKKSEQLAESISKAGSKTAETAVKPAGKLTKAASALLQKIPGGSKIAGKLGKAGKFMKSSGAGIMLVFSGISELLTEVKPTFQELCKEKGMKQLAKSAIKVAGDTAGFIAGEQIGTAIGSAIGTAIFPGIGTAIGAVVGFAGGMLGSYAAGKLTKAITGKTEREIAKEQMQEAAAANLSNNNNELELLKQEVLSKIQSDYEINNGQLSEDAKTAAKILNDLETKSSPFSSFTI